MTFTYANGSDIYVEKDHVAGKIAEDIRSGKVVEIYMEAEKIPDTENDTFEKRLTYYYIGQFSRYIKKVQSVLERHVTQTASK